MIALAIFFWYSGILNILINILKKEPCVRYYNLADMSLALKNSAVQTFSCVGLHSCMYIRV